MHDLVALCARLDTGANFYFMTWGRVLNAVDSSSLERLVEDYGREMVPPGTEIVSIQVCSSLTEAAEAPLFYESFFEFCNDGVPYGSEYEAWRSTVEAELRAGRLISALGPF